MLRGFKTERRNQRDVSQLLPLIVDFFFTFFSLLSKTQRDHRLNAAPNFSSLYPECSPRYYKYVTFRTKMDTKLIIRYHALSKKIFKYFTLALETSFAAFSKVLVFISDGSNSTYKKIERITSLLVNNRES